MDNKKLFNYLIDNFEGNFVGIQGWSDGKQEGFSQKFIKCETKNYEKFNNIVKEINMNLAVGFCINPLKEEKRKEDSVIKFNHILLDIDGGREQTNEYEKIKSFLNKINIKYKFSDISGNGFHFLLPVNIDKKDKNKIGIFLNYMKSETGIETLDTTVKLTTQILRIPGSIHRKNKEPFMTKYLDWNELSSEDIETNTKNILKLIPVETKKEKSNKIINTTGNNEGDIFFTTILRDNNIRQQLIDKDGIEKNNILFKNLAIFQIQQPNMENEIEEFIEDCGHTIAEFQGWINKTENNSISEINYLEIKNWIETYNLLFLEDLIKEQTMVKGNYLNNFEIAYLKDIESSWRYLIFEKATNDYNKNDESSFYTSIMNTAKSDGFDFLKYYDIPKANDKGVLTLTARKNMLKEKLKETIDEMCLLKTINNIGYYPTDKRFYKFAGKEYFNIYKPGPLEYYNDIKENFNFPYIKKLLEHLTNNKSENYNYLVNWLSFILQNPAVKLSTSLIFQGTQGIGKGRFKEWVLIKIWGSQNVEQINETHLAEKWGDWLVGTRFVVTNEIKIEGKGAKDKIKRIKEYSSDEELSVQIKGVNTTSIRNWSHWIHFSDQYLPIPLEKSDRRHTVFYNGISLPSEISSALSPDVNPGYLEKELKNFVCYLRSLNPKMEDVNKPLDNKEKRDLIEGTKSSVLLFIDELRNSDNMTVFSKIYNSELTLFEDRFDKNTKITVTDLYKIYCCWCRVDVLYIKAKRNFTVELKNDLGFTTKTSEKFMNRQTYFDLEEVFKK